MAFYVQIITSIFTKKNTFLFTIGLFPAITKLENSALSTKMLLSF